MVLRGAWEAVTYGTHVGKKGKEAAEPSWKKTLQSSPHLRRGMEMQKRPARHPVWPESKTCPLGWTVKAPPAAVRTFSVGNRRPGGIISQ